MFCLDSLPVTQKKKTAGQQRRPQYQKRLLLPPSTTAQAVTGEETPLFAKPPHNLVALSSETAIQTNELAPDLFLHKSKVCTPKTQTREGHYIKTGRLFSLPDASDHQQRLFTPTQTVEE